jgi:FSR family fosmidomycin resistance protein-like MFS transporter
MNGFFFSLLLGLAHGLSDAAAGFLVGILFKLSGGANSGYLIFLYNGLAFGLQPIAGLVIDRSRQPKRFTAIGLALTAVGLLILYPGLRWSIALIGTGSALFHAAGGAMAISNTPQRASGPGVFAAFGVVGLAFGLSLSPYHSFFTITVFSVALFTFALILWFGRVSQETAEHQPGTFGAGNELWIILLVMAFALRSFVWSGVDRAVADFSSLAIWLALAAGAGKFLGGFVSDRFGWSRWAVTSLGLSLALLVSGQNNIFLLLLGVFFLQSVTALTVAAFGQMLPGSPALAASLGFGAAVILGGMPFLFIQHMGVAAILVALSGSMVGYWLILRIPKTINPDVILNESA